MNRLVLSIAALATVAGCGNFRPPPGGYVYQPPPPLETNPFAIRNQMQRTSPVQAPTYQAPQQGVTAVWTGKSTMGQSVTGMSIFECEYQYAGHTFVRGYQGSCPSTIQVQ